MDEFADSCEIESIAMDNLGVYLSLLEKWQRRFNLVGPKTLDDPWRRHFLDSAQLIPFIKSMQGPVIDMGTGAGFPGLVLSILGTPDVHLIESDANKTEFLRQVIRETKATATIHRVRMEDYDGPKATCLTSRACASLGALLDYGQRISKPGARALFLKGKTCPDELTTAQGLWHIEHTCHPSQSDPNGIVLEIHEFTRR
ncbi:MAG: 16S rRNA (guanine(527)-N(7))-methyltransferase RsmG [Rhodospirillaceae bacterium]|nr:16S rRNA (guanine(527)-N(7))-methyltransferase RsmG [Rhodospirillaceae bacterium]MBT3557885.1 16S rRNA (guanine(527)-N(7))-methyltransferase RsmG [Rhodospirillales bacterium]MBT4040742.1 16S rRNA (guanine(527)-N(7))-methyltransferase RsmG [Rhodospirillales bacterium]MBT4628216.1 16S rRNA (guanine(527)-N(7))-methyltransferase RsmG [Rhodospirillales bacterium]MBT5350839.1 16S rRNA (guanine(527)-N(7))-methyltransferase RsmG [Rhodospirillales bacterium]